MVMQVMRLNSSEDRGNEHRINRGPTPNYYYQSYEPKTTNYILINGFDRVAGGFDSRRGWF